MSSRKNRPPTETATSPTAPPAPAPSAGLGGAPTRPQRATPAKAEPTVCRIHWGGECLTRTYNRKPAIKYTDVPIEHLALYESKLAKQKSHKSKVKHIERIELI